MDAVAWFLVVGGLLVAMALAGSVLKRLPLSAAMFYLAAGYGIGPAGLGLLTPDPVRHAGLLERLTEAAVLVSLFTAGLKLRGPLDGRQWGPAVRLAFGSMALTVGLVTVVGVYGLGLPVGAAVLLGAVLAPTDPVLASDVQLAGPWDKDRLRFTLTGEAGLNDGTAFPFVMLGLGLLGLHDLGLFGWKWAAVDVLWAGIGGLVVGGGLGTLLGKLVVYLRKHHREAVGLDEFLALGLIALSYGAALFVHTYGFLAVFAAGLALRRVEMRATEKRPADRPDVPAGDGDPAVDPDKAPAYLAGELLGFNERVERIAEVAVVVVLGSMLSPAVVTADAVWFVPVLFLVVRPVAVAVGLVGSGWTGFETRLIGWFGVRGVGSVYYLMFAVSHGLPAPLAVTLTQLTLAAVAASVIAHGVSVTPLMTVYAKVRRRPAVSPSAG